MKGLRTVIFNVLIAALAGALPVIAGIDWTQYVSPTVAMVIVAAANVGLRAITSTPIGKSA